MKKRLTINNSSTIDFDMTPMIDVVFLLMIFFVLTFRTVSQEGTFSVRMPLAGIAAQSLNIDVPAEPFRVRLHADSSGDIAAIVIGDRPLGTSFETLREQVKNYVATLSSKARGELEAELTCDYNLKYEYTVKAMTAVSGYFENGHVVPLIEKIKFVER